jgi:hypothetical protein
MLSDFLLDAVVTAAVENFTHPTGLAGWVFKAGSFPASRIKCSTESRFAPSAGKLVRIKLSPVHRRLMVLAACVAFCATPAVFSVLRFLIGDFLTVSFGGT